MRAGLAQPVQLNLLDENRVGENLHNMNSAPNMAIDDATVWEIAMRGGAVRVGFATVSGSNGN
jgi:hypothetical protein